MLWITRSHVHVDRVACPWLITRFIDSDADFLFVPASQIEKVAAETGAIPFDAAALGRRLPDSQENARTADRVEPVERRDVRSVRKEVREGRHSRPCAAQKVRAVFRDENPRIRHTGRHQHDVRGHR